MKNLFLAIFLIFSGPLWAVDAPPDPQIALPESISYTKSFTYPARPHKADASPEEQKLAEFLGRIARLEKVEITKSGNIQKEKESYSDGTKREVWRAGEIGYIVDPSAPERITVVTPQMGEESSRSLMGGGAMFSEVAWVNADAFQGEVVRKGVDCFFYKNGSQQVWVEKASRLPIFLQSPEMQIDYSYKPSTEVLQLPSTFARKREAVERAWRGQR